MIIRANCKINIGLDVLRRRQDGFHDLSTVMYPIFGLYDQVNVERIDSAQIEFLSKGLVIDCPADKNLCVRAARLMQQRYSTPAVRITLNKMIPFGAGLGGGSADATAVIVAMNSIFELGLSEDRLISIAAELGSDTAFFVRNTPQLCTARGEVMNAIDLDLSHYHIAIIKPEVGVSTTQAYGGVKPQIPETPLQELVTRPIEEWQGRVKNDFEPHIFEIYPILAQIKKELLEAGALYAAMSGSGSTIYGIFEESDNSFKDLRSIEFGNGYKPLVMRLNNYI
ncbi:MAG: 4-(cytidine 5'-diphospho)-2-C-methyl-D-erythritol kinase [Rikenellaceae bacterium]